MSQPSNTPPRTGSRRDRANEPNERRRAELRQAGMCRDCKGPSGGKQRCTDCLRRSEEATARDRGQGRPGPPLDIDIDIRDFRFAAEELGKAYSGHTAVRMLGSMPKRKRDELLGEPQHNALLAWKFLVEVLERAGKVSVRRRGASLIVTAR